MTDDKRLIGNKCHEVHELLTKAYWAKDRSEPITQKAISNSLNYAISETNSERLVGFVGVFVKYLNVGTFKYEK